MEQGIIVEDSMLLNMAASYQDVKKLLSDTIVACKHHFESADEFAKAEQVIQESEVVYKNYEEKVLTY